MVHRFVFEAMVSWGFDSWQDSLTLAMVVDAGNKMIAGLREEEAEAPEGFRDEMKILNQFKREQQYGDPFVGAFHSSESGDLYMPHKFKNYMRLLEDSLSSSDIGSMVVEMAKFIIFRANMASMQFLWTPQIGSQDYPYETLSKLYNLCNEHIQLRMQDYD